eukprot:scaffold1515_cov162-Amphora_coffeaeformis.AAC.11
MRTRSTRFFVILLHLVGCRPRPPYFQQGIVGVQPWPIVLEKLDLSTLFKEDESARVDMDKEEAVWLQNEQGRCLGPTARFTDCGDATLWFIVKRKIPRRRKFLQMGVWGVDEDDNNAPPLPGVVQEGFAFYLVDRDVEGAQSSSKSDITSEAKKRGWWKRIVKRKKQPKMECLTYQADGQVSVNTCSRKVSWAWDMDSEGTLKPVTPGSVKADECLINHQSGVALGPCGDVENSVNLSVVRYRAVSLPDALQHLKGKEEAPGVSAMSVLESRSKVPEEEVEPPKANLPSRQRDLAHLHASEPSRLTSLKNSSKPSLSRAKDVDESPRRSPLQFLHKASPVHAVEKTFAGSRNAGSASSRVGTAPTTPHRTRKIPVHPYIAVAKNEIWTDPQTGLEYPTDLTRYLKNDRKAEGRQTLMGVGQYIKGYVIKVYGVAFYVSKRDVLADPFFADYAHMSPDELKTHPEFYEHLRTDAENFERTIVIKINMQLAADTIRSSLHADWKMLTDEAKNALINSSLQPRPATPEFLEVVADETNNPGRCSCGQVCPPEYEADLDCCARGTELAFTWLKTGELEVRLNGELMETFPRPDIAKGILFEYLRYDDPISPQFRDNVVQGFPFLLAPLAQVKGVQLPISKVGTSASASLPPHKALWQVLEVASATAADWASGASQAALEAASQQAAALGRFVENGAQNMLQEGNRRRVMLIHHVQGLPDFIRGVITSTPPAVVVNDTLLLDPLEEDPTMSRLAQFLRDNIYPDEIGPPVREVHPRRQVYILLVHLYLLLLLIVSFPASYTTKLIRRKKSSHSGGTKTGLPLKAKSLSYYL